MIRAFAAWAFLVLASACSPSVGGPPSPARPALWAIEDARGTAIGWLFGTIHALPRDTAWTTPAIDRAIDRAGVLVVEVRDLDPARLSATLQSMASDEPVVPLLQRVSAADRGELAAIFARTDTPPDALDGLETWAAALAVAKLVGQGSGGVGVDHGLIARFADRPIAELEGAQNQLAIFDRLTERDQRSLLAAVIAEKDNPETDARELAAAWLAGDLARLETSTRQGLLADPALYRALASGRNEAWAAKLVPLLTSGRASGRRPLIAVGAAHMVGPDGLPALLAARGYRVRRIQ